jgi:hypothetical protein
MHSQAVAPAKTRNDTTGLNLESFASRPAPENGEATRNVWDGTANPQVAENLEALARVFRTGGCPILAQQGWVLGCFRLCKQK